MKNILLGAVLIVAFLPQVSFGATNQPTAPNVKTTPIVPNVKTIPTVPVIPTPPPPVVTPPPSTVTNPQLVAFENQQQNQALAFFAQQGTERAAFIKANGDIITAQDKIVKAWVESRRPLIEQAKKTGDWTKVPRSSMPAISDPTFSSFVAKQQSDKIAFFAAQAQALQKFKASLGITS